MLAVDRCLYKKIVNQVMNSDIIFLENLQFDLSATWSHAKKRGVTMEQIALWWSERPAKLAGLELKVTKFSYFCCQFYITTLWKSRLRYFY